MTTFTTNFGWPIPSGTDQPDGVAQFSALATPIDSTVFAGIPYAARQTLGGSAASVTFSSIPSSLRSLRIRWTARSDNASQIQFLLLRINGDSASNYNAEWITGANTTVAANNNGGTTSATCGIMTGASAPAGVYGNGTIDFVGWDSPHSTFLGFSHAGVALGTGVANFWTISGGGHYFQAGPYTSVTFIPQAGNFVAGSDFQIEGVRT